MARITFSCDPVDMGRKLYLRGSVDIQPGITCLVGANGAGKTTFLRIIKERKKKGATVLNYSDLSDGRQNAMSRYGYLGQTDKLALAFMSSEGENIVNNFGNFVGRMGRAIRLNEECEKPKEVWILLDGIDSGLSIDRVIEVREFIEWFAKEEVPKAKGTEVYILIAVNAFEMCRDLQCLDVRNMKYMKFDDYETYKSFIMKSGKALRKRDRKE